MRVITVGWIAASLVVDQCGAFSPSAGLGGSLALRNGVSPLGRHIGRASAGAMQGRGLRMQQGGGEQEEVVEITREELAALAKQAGIKIQIGNNPIEGGAPRQPVPTQPSANNFQPLLDALEPILKLPPILRYPIFIAATGAASSILLPLFGSSSIGEMTGRTSEPTQEAVAPAAAPSKAKSETATATVGAATSKASSKKAKGPFPDLSNLAPPPEELNIVKSCDKWPWSLTPTCTDPDIGNKGMLKNLDQYTKPNEEVRKMREDFDNRQKAQREAIQAEKAAKAATKE